MTSPLGGVGRDDGAIAEGGGGGGQSGTRVDAGSMLVCFATPQAERWSDGRWVKRRPHSARGGGLNGRTQRASPSRAAQPLEPRSRGQTAVK